MLIKNNSKIRKVKYSLINLLSLIIFTTMEIWAQMPSVPVPVPEEEIIEEDFTWQYILLFVLLLGLIGAILWVINNKKNQKNTAISKNTASNENSWERDSLDADKEMEWLRKNTKIVNKKKNPVKKNFGNRLPQTSKVLRRNGTDETHLVESAVNGSEKTLPKLPVFSVQKLELARPFTPLSISNDPALMSAVEQTYDELEEDELVREIALRILNAFKTRNSVEALAQIALYDLSSNLRSRAVTILSDFDHESVFETVLLACADPTREVRAAAARALFRLSFDRADAYLRIAESEEDGRMIQAARAAIEADLVERSLVRLVHEDKKTAFEAVALVALLIKAGETKEVFYALENHSDINVRKAVLHVIKITKNKKALEGLYSMLEKNSLSIEFQEEVDKTIEEIGFVTA